MPAYLFDDNLQSYAPGSGFPAGFFGNGIGFINQFIDGSASPTPSPIGFYENAGIYFAFFGTACAFPVNSSLASYFTGTTTVAWWGFTEGQTFFPGPGSVQLASIDPVAFIGPTLLSVEFQSDNSVSLVTPGDSVNSLAQCFDFFTWTFFSMTVQFGTTGTYVTVTVSLYVNGQQLIAPTTLVSNILVSSLYNATPGINQWNFGNGYYGYLAATSGIEALPFYPAPSGTINAKSPQLVAEFANLPVQPYARSAQVVAEFGNLPPPPFAWSPQLIVEIIIAGLISGGVFPEYIKARARPAH